MKERGLDPRALDLPALCKAGAELRGQWPLSGMARLGTGFCAASDGSAAWTARGELVPVIGAEPELWLALNAHAEVPLECQRCLQPMAQALQVQRRFRFVRSEDDAARLDEESEDDVMVLSARLDLHELLEDELILGLPIVARHEAACPQPLAGAAAPGASTEDDVPAPHPFAALAALRGRSGGA